MSMFPMYLQTDRLGRRDMQPSTASTRRLILGLTPDGAINLLSPANQAQGQPSVRNINIARENFEVNLDVSHFGLEDISVKIVDGYLIIQASHDERQDEFGFVKRQFTRRYALPEGCDFDAIEARMSSDGVLTVVAPRSAPRNERIVPMIQTGPVRSLATVKAEVGDGEAPEAEAIAETLQ
ncbi:hsp20/alpha crystallin family domain-containing protein [Phthorimaea operculella]|nr:hsp20/alpha crystallin family domain-containing protein [Phthorimaea operculella]